MPRLARLIRPLILSLLAVSALAQAAEPARPRIGLVLGGGGARGAAHVGILEVLQKNRIPVDCVAGTSMGALIAGAWAAGMSPAAMREALRRAADKVPERIALIGPAIDGCTVARNPAYSSSCVWRCQAIRRSIWPRSKISPPQTPHGSARSMAVSRHSRCNGQPRQSDFAISRSAGASAR